MNSTVITIEDIKREFSITEKDISEIEKCLESKLCEEHPDKSSGVFRDINHENHYYKIQNALDFIKQQNKKNDQLVSIDTVRDLLSAVTNRNLQQEQDHNIQNCIDGAIKKIPSQNLMPKISLSTITVIITAIWLFPSTITEHPILSELIDIHSMIFTAVWIEILFITAFFWIFISMLENKKKDYLESLSTELYQNKLFDNFLLLKNKQKYFSKDDLVLFISGGKKQRYLLLISRIKYYNEIPLSLADSIAQKIIDNAINQRVIEKMTSKTLSQRYKIIVNEDLY